MKMKMNKKGVQLKSAFFAVTVISLFVVMVGNWIISWNSQYGSGVTYDLDKYNKLSSISLSVGEQRSSIGAQSSDTGSDAESSTFRRVFGIITNIFAPFEIVFGNDGMLDSIIERFGIPYEVELAIIIMMSASLIFTIIAIIFRREKA